MRARWLIPTLAALAVVALTLSLGDWQLRRADEKRQLQARREAARAAPPIDLNTLGRRGEAPFDAAALDGHRVALSGTLLPQWSLMLDNRTRQHVAGVHLITPVRLTGSRRVVLVLRGWAATDPADRGRMPAAIGDPAGELRFEGLAQASLAQPIELAASPPPAPGQRLWQHFTFERFRDWSGLDCEPVLVRQISALDDGLARDWVEPGIDVDRHTAYAVQWFALAAVCAGLWLWFVVIGPVRRAQRRASNGGHPSG